MVGKEECMDIWSLKRQGFSDSAISRRVGLDRRTVKKYLEKRDFPRYSTVNRGSKLVVPEKVVFSERAVKLVP
jgi:transposase